MSDETKLSGHIYVESPMRWDAAPLNPYDEGMYGVFMSGGITGCPDWQAEMRTLLQNSGYVLINPRRADFPIHDPSAARAQIQWEFDHLRQAEGILFWFPAATLCPITLYELGAWSMTDKPIAVGVEPGYAREQDVRIQTELSRGLPVASSLEELAQQTLNLFVEAS